MTDDPEHDDPEHDDLEDPAMVEVMRRFAETVRTPLAPGRQPLFAPPPETSALARRLDAVDRELAARARRGWVPWLAGLLTAAVVLFAIWTRAPDLAPHFQLALVDELGERRAAGPIWETAAEGYTIRLDVPVQGWLRAVLYDGSGEVFPLVVAAGDARTVRLTGRRDLYCRFDGRDEQDLIVLVTAVPIDEATLQRTFPERIAAFAAPERTDQIQTAIARAQRELAAQTQHRRIRRRQ